MSIKLRPYQEKLVDDTRAGFSQGNKSVLVVLPTGGGKTFIFSYITMLAKAVRNQRIIILTHRQELLYQASDSLNALGVEHGLISPQYGISIEPVNVASAWTLVRRLKTVKAPHLIIIDEAHHAVPNNTWGKIIDSFPHARILGVTATPSRLDGSGLGSAVGGLFDTMVQGPQMKELQSMGFLTDYDYYCPPTNIDLSDVGTTGGDYTRGKLGKAMDKPVITGCAVEHYAKICPGEPAIAFCASVEHAEHTAEQFNAAGYRALSLDGNMDKTARKQAIKALGERRINVLTSCDIISEGTDIPIVTVAILLRPTQSLGLYLQQVGRVLRPAPGKEKAIILDHVGNVLIHGMPNEDRHWELNASKRNRKKKKKDDELDPLQLRACEKCYKPFKPPKEMCPHCGAIIEVKTRKISEKEGELQKIKEEKQRKIKARRREQGKARSLVDLILHGKTKGYKEGWALRVYKSRGNNVTIQEFEDAKREALLRG